LRRTEAPAVGANGSVKQVNVAITKSRVFFFHIASLLTATFNRSVISEPYLPFAIAAAPVAYWAYSRIG
jgi:hypothetical protein